MKTNALAVDWELWIETPGPPPTVPALDFSNPD
jgi:hypothetical protein